VHGTLLFIVMMPSRLQDQHLRRLGFKLIDGEGWGDGDAEGEHPPCAVNIYLDHGDGGPSDLVINLKLPNTFIGCFAGSIQEAPLRAGLNGARSFVSRFASVRDLLLCAKHLFRLPLPGVADEQSDLFSPEF
jgi:hypothetical protein